MFLVNMLISIYFFLKLKTNHALQNKNLLREGKLDKSCQALQQDRTKLNINLDS